MTEGSSSLFKFGVEFAAAGEVTAIQQGNGELEVVGMNPLRLFQRARHGARAQTDVPHRLGAGANLFFVRRLNFFVGAEEEHIHIGAGKQFAASKAARSDQRNVILSARRDLLPQRPQQRANDLRTAANDRRPVARALKALAQLG
jgi:hypothetical protein